MTTNFLVLPVSVSTGFSGGDGMPRIYEDENTGGIGLAIDEGLLVCRLSWFGSRPVYTAVDLAYHPLPVFVVDATEFSIYGSFDGFPVFKNGGNYILHTEEDGWVYVPGSFKAPTEWKYSGSDAWGGDAWYSLSVNAGGGFETSVEVTRRGTNRNSPDSTLPEITLRWPRWEKVNRSGEGLFGRYAPVGASGPARLFGSPHFSSDLGTWVGVGPHVYACREAGLVLAPRAGGVWETGPIEPGSPYHYRSNNEPGINQSATLTPYTDAGAPVADADSVTLTYTGLGASGRTTTVRMAEVAQWL